MIVFEAKLHTNPVKISLDKGISRSVNAFFPRQLIKNKKIHVIELF